MNITFLIGNGFDLRMGMKTRFSDMYEAYIDSESSSDVIKKFKDMLRMDAPEYKTWGDFEMAMAQKAKEFADEDSFIECLRDFKVHMASHLEKQQSMFLERLAVSDDAQRLSTREVSNSVEKFYMGLTPNTRNALSGMGDNRDPKYEFISFNYTKVFDRILSPFYGEVMHIHGTLDADVVVGADNLGQVKDLPYITTRRFERAFIKPTFNKSFDNSRVEKAEEIIKKSDIICIYGMSLGESDYSWVARIKEWLLSHKDNHLVYFVHDERVFSKLNWDAIMDEEDGRIAGLLGKICDSGDEMGKIFDQIHVPVGYDIFSVDEILKKEQLRILDENAKKTAIRKRIEELPLKAELV